MTSQERAIYYRYARSPTSMGRGDSPDNIQATLFFSELPGSSPGRELPLILAGNYIQTESTDVTRGDFEATTTSGVSTQTTALSFDVVRQALVRAREPEPNSYLVTDVNAEANIITALICHADGRRPANVCGRAVIKQILKHVK
jgi:hypothetical protein